MTRDLRYPDFAVIGAAKAGTTALYWYLAEHPQIFMSPVKETNFFAYGLDEHGDLLYGDPELHRFPVKTTRQYGELFAQASEGAVVGEASPIYLECPDAAGRMHELVPTIRIVCGLRNPVDRAYSDYVMYLRSRRRSLDPARDLTEGSEWALPDSHWMRIGRYYKMLARYYRRFPREHIHVYLFDDLSGAPTHVVQEIYRFLGVDAVFIPDFDTPHNVGGVPRNMLVERILSSSSARRALAPVVPRRAANWARRLRTANVDKAPPIPEDLRAVLALHFKEEVEKTEQLIGRDLATWR